MHVWQLYRDKCEDMAAFDFGVKGQVRLVSRRRVLWHCRVSSVCNGAGRTARHCLHSVQHRTLPHTACCTQGSCAHTNALCMCLIFIKQVHCLVNIGTETKFCVEFNATGQTSQEAVRSVKSQCTEAGVRDRGGACPLLSAVRPGKQSRLM